MPAELPKIDLEQATAEALSAVLDQIVHLFPEYQKNDVQMALKAGELALEIAKRLPDPQKRYVGLHYAGRANYVATNFEKALSYLNPIIDEQKQIEDTEIVGRTYGLLSSILYRQSDYQTSLEYSFRALDILEGSERKTLISSIYNLIGGIQYSLENLDEALVYFEKSLEMEKELENPSGMATALNSLGLIFGKRDAFEQSLASFSEALHLYQSIDEASGIAYSLANIGNTYLKMQEFLKALDYLDQAKTIFSKLGDRNSLANLHINQARIYFDLNDLEKAIEQLSEGSNLAREIGARSQELDCYKGLADIYDKLGNYKVALGYFRQAYHLERELFGLEKSKQIAEIKTKFETERKERENEIYRLRTVELANALEELKNTQSKLVESEKMASLGNLVAGVAHEINTPVGICVTAASTIEGHLETLAQKHMTHELTRDEFEETLETVYEANSLILKNLTRTAELIDTFKQISADQAAEQPRKFQLKPYLHDILLSLKPLYHPNHISVTLDCPDDLSLRSYPGIFAQIITNLVENSVKHGFSDSETGQISISCLCDGQNLTITYQDTGQGIEPAIQSRIFDPFFTTNKTKGTGLGLNIVYNLVTQKLNGHIQLAKQSGRGVCFIIHCPCQMGGEIHE